MLRDVLRSIAGYRLALGAVIALAIVEALLSALSVTALIPVGGAFIAGGDSAAESPVQWPLSEVASVIGAGPVPALLLLASLLVAKVAVSLTRTVLTAHIKRRIWQRWARRLVETFLFMPYRSWLRQDSGQLINLLGGELTRATSVLSSFVSMLTHLFSFLMLFLSMIIVDWRIVAAASVVGVFLHFFGLRRLGRRARRYGEQAVSFARAATGLVAETVHALKDIRLLRAEGRRLTEVDKAVAKTTNNDYHTTILQAVPTNAVELLLAAVIALMAVILLAAAPDSVAPATLPVMLYFLVGLFRMSSYAANVATLNVKLVSRYPSLLAVIRGMKGERDAALVDKLGAEPTQEEIERWRPRSGFAFHDLSVSHDDKRIVGNVNLTLPLGSVTYLFGPSGSGKSSIADTLARLHEPAPGTLLVDGRDALSVPVAVWRSLIGYVSQEPLLFSGSLLENLQMGRAQASSVEAKEALSAAGALDFVEALPQGLDTHLAERAKTISGGQKCRIAIARALMRRPSLLILDESMGGVEVALEADIIQRLRNMPDLATLIISHRWDNAHLADQVATLDAGSLHVTQPVAPSPKTAIEAS